MNGFHVYIMTSWNTACKQEEWCFQWPLQCLHAELYWPQAQFYRCRFENSAHFQQQVIISFHSQTHFKKLYTHETFDFTRDPLERDTGFLWGTFLSSLSSPECWWGLTISLCNWGFDWTSVVDRLLDAIDRIDDLTEHFLSWLWPFGEDSDLYGVLVCEL